MTTPQARRQACLCAHHSGHMTLISEAGLIGNGRKALATSLQQCHGLRDLQAARVNPDAATESIFERARNVYRVHSGNGRELAHRRNVGRVLLQIVPHPGQPGSFVTFDTPDAAGVGHKLKDKAFSDQGGRATRLPHGAPDTGTEHGKGGIFSVPRFVEKTDFAPQFGKPCSFYLYGKDARLNRVMAICVMLASRMDDHRSRRGNPLFPADGFVIATGQYHTDAGKLMVVAFDGQ